MKKKTEEGQLFEIMHHKLVPQHVIMLDEEVNELFKRYNITPDQLPKILASDPAVISIGAKPGQFVIV